MHCVRLVVVIVFSRSHEPCSLCCIFSLTLFYSVFLFLSSSSPNSAFPALSCLPLYRAARETSSRSPNQKSRIIELKQPDLNTFSSFGSLNLSKRNQSHQTRRSDLTWFELARFEYFPIFGSQSLSKRNQSRQTRRSDLTWFESARFEYFLNPDLNTFSIFGSQNLSKRNQSHQTRRSDMTWFESARFEYFFNLWQPKPVQKESTYMKRMHVIMRCVAGSVRCGFGPGPGPGLREARRSRLEAIWVCGEEA